MSLAVLISRSLAGVRALPVTVETHLSGGMPRVNIVGLPDTEVREAGERVRAAIMNSNFEFPARRVTINLAPADLPKEGSRFDLPMALGILAAAGQIPKSALANCEFVGELALGGQLRPVSGMLPIALAAAKSGRTLFAPAGNAAVCALAADAETYCAPDLLAVCAHLTGKTPLARRTQKPPPAVNGNYECFSEVKGQSATKRALEVAAAGGHSALMQGPPGGGKSMLAMRFPGLMPPLEEHEAIDSASVLSLTGGVSTSRRHGGGGLFERRTTVARRRRSWAAARIRARARFRSPIAGFCFWTNCPNSTAPRSRPCASRSKAAKSPSRARRGRRAFRRASNCWRR